MSTSEQKPKRVWKNVVLTGFMGTGKSTVGRLLAEELGFTFVDTDELIERRHGPIRRIFSESGEEVFREIEQDVAKELAYENESVISTGGRFMLDEHNAKLLSKSNRVFCLVADFDILMERLMRRRSSRPLLVGGDPYKKVADLLAEREAGYAKFEAVSTNVTSPQHVVYDILARLKSD